MLTQAAQGLALVLMLGAFAAAFGALTARSLYAMCVYLVVTGACAAATVLTLGSPDAAIAQTLVGVVLTPLLLLAAILLSTRATKPRREGRPWLTLIAAAAAFAAVMLVAPDLGPPRASPPAQTGALAPWLTILVFVAVAACVGLLGYGERGALQRAPREPEQ